MKKTLFPALAAALVLAACGTKTTGQAEVAAEAAAQQVVSSDIAYVQVEAVLAQCDLYKNEGVALQEKTEKAQKSWAQREQNLQAEAAQLQQKYEKGLITSRDAQAQQESIQKKVASYQSNAQKEAQTLDEENYVFTNRAQDLLHRAVAGDQQRQEVQTDPQRLGADRRGHDAQHHPRRAGEGQRAVCRRQKGREEVAPPAKNKKTGFPARRKSVFFISWAS